MSAGRRSPSTRAAADQVQSDTWSTGPGSEGRSQLRWDRTEASGFARRRTRRSEAQLNIMHIIGVQIAQARMASPRLYDAEFRAAEPAGTVVAWEPGTFYLMRVKMSGCGTVTSSKARPWPEVCQSRFRTIAVLSFMLSALRHSDITQAGAARARRRTGLSRCRPRRRRVPPQAGIHTLSSAET